VPLRLAQLLVFFFQIQIASADGPFTLATLTPYAIQRFCVQDCLAAGEPGGGPALPYYLSCPQPYSDGCVCKGDLSASAAGFLSSCANQYCSGNAADVSNAVSLYTAYCGSQLSLTFASPATIGSGSAYSSLRDCAQNCLWAGPPDGEPAMPFAINCPVVNACLCRADLSTSAESYLSTCVNKWCSGSTDDISSAIQVYTDYCSGANSVATATQNSAQPGSTTGISSILPFCLLFSSLIRANTF